MTGVLERHGGPSALHENRATTLATIATLTGHVQPVDALPDGSIPDVLRLRPTDGSLFVGDAKATETPGNAATVGRLDRYVRCLAAWVRGHGSGLLALAVADADAYGWLRVLRDLCLQQSLGIQVDGHVDYLEVGTAVVWQSFASMPALRHVGTPARGVEWEPPRRELVLSKLGGVTVARPPNSTVRLPSASPDCCDSPALSRLPRRGVETAFPRVIAFFGHEAAW